MKKVQTFVRLHEFHQDTDCILYIIQCAAALFRHRAISQEAGAMERAPEADGRGRIALTPELQKGSLHNVFGSRPLTAVSEAL